MTEIPSEACRAGYLDAARAPLRQSADEIKAYAEGMRLRALASSAHLRRSRTVGPPPFPAWRSPHARKQPRSDRRQPLACATTPLGQDHMPQPRRVRRRRMAGPRRVATLCRSPRARLLRVGWTAGLRRPRWHRHEPVDAEDSRAVLWMSHRPMISLHSSAEFIAALPSLARGSWFSSSRFGDKWSRQHPRGRLGRCRPSWKILAGGDSQRPHGSAMQT